MPQSRSQNRFSVCFDRQQETWYARLEPPARVPLERGALEDILALYNGIHRGLPLTLLPQESLQALHDERRALQQTIRQLYDFIDREITTRPDTGAQTTPEEPARRRETAARRLHRWLRRASRARA